MRILIVHNYYQHRGGEDVVFEQEVQLLSARHEVMTVCLQNRRGMKGLLQYLFYPWNIFAARKVLRQVALFNPDIVHVHNTHYALGPLIFRSLYRHRIPVIQTLHNLRILDPSATLFHDGKVFTDTIDKEFPWRSVRKRVLDNSLIKTFITAATYYLHKKLGTWRDVGRFLVFSGFTRDLLLRSTLRLRADQIAIKPNWVRPIEQDAYSDREDFYIYIGRLSTEKGVVPMLEAFGRTDHILKIYGTGPLQDIVLRYAEAHPNIQYYGFQDKETFYQVLYRAQAIIVPSICYEGMPMAVLDAFASGTPVIASKIGILSEIVKEGKHGLHFEANNPTSLVSSLEKWQRIDPKEKERISSYCKNEYTAKYTPEKNVSLLENIYVETIEQYIK